MSNPHTVKAFDRELQALTRNVKMLGDFAERNSRMRCERFCTVIGL